MAIRRIAIRPSPPLLTHQIGNIKGQRSSRQFCQTEHPNLQQEAQLKAHPLQPKNLVLHHWNIGKNTPAPTEGGTNQNGVSDLWEKKYNHSDLYPSFNPTADPDDDGWTNAQEATPGTDPGSGSGLTGGSWTAIGGPRIGTSIAQTTQYIVQVELTDIKEYANTDDHITITPPICIRTTAKVASDPTGRVSHEARCEVGRRD
jgi:hypothetical protein